MMSNSNQNMNLQHVKPVQAAYCGLHNLAENWSWTRDVNGRDRDETETCLPPETETLTIFFSRDETKTRHWYVSRPRSRDASRDRDHNPAVHDNTRCCCAAIVGCKLRQQMKHNILIMMSAVQIRNFEIIQQEWARDVKARDPDETNTLTSRD